MTTKVTCPHCGRLIEWSAASPFRPFCSERCKLIDLGDWLAENHRIPDSTPVDEMSEDPPPSEGSRPTH
jgi:hypothetical protein